MMSRTNGSASRHKMLPVGATPTSRLETTASRDVGVAPTNPVLTNHFQPLTNTP